MSDWPLITHEHAGAIAAYRAGRAISAAQFLHDVHTLATQLPDSGHVLNFFSDRYRFAVGLGASLVRGQCSVLPSTHTPEVIRELRAFAPDVFCLTDDANCPLALPQTLIRTLPSDEAHARVPASMAPVPRIPAQQLAAYIFTSGSTGTPVPHAKRWGDLVQCVRAEGVRLRRIAERPCAILGTVPAQHSYGFESTVLLALQTGNALCAERPFFPADIAAALNAIPAPRVLISTPVHLRALLSAQLPLPALELIVSATAMLPANMAREVESHFNAPLLEIYGSTESGQIATRRTANETQWELWPGVRLKLVEGRCWAQGGHVAQPTLLADILEPVGEQHFLLHGRTADLVNIAGKRSSLSYLNHQLNAIAGVHDGAFFIREDAQSSQAGVTRLAAVVVAPSLSEAAILQGLRERIDPVFLPRPLLLVEHLPRNQTGKLPQQTLQSLAEEAAARQPHLFA